MDQLALLFVLLLGSVVTVSLGPTKRLHKRRDYDEEIPVGRRETVVMWWSGMRGVASVAPPGYRWEVPPGPGDSPRSWTASCASWTYAACADVGAAVAASDGGGGRKIKVWRAPW
ncbi:hypothetical protein [Streptomyces sp. NPDC002133]|uniref:hypothetical protein n=1 Tax=Streptomyces sp. NPDC002133 TaxID=3154409 RepID=UPI0033283720